MSDDDMRELARRLWPFLQERIDEAVQAAVERAIQRAPRDTWLPATVVGVASPVAEIIIDTPDDEPTAEIQGIIVQAITPAEGDRVMTVHTPPHGRYVIGVIDQTGGIG